MRGDQEIAGGRCWSCSLAYAVLRRVSDVSHAEWWLWNETPWPWGRCRDVVPVLLREALRVASSRIEGRWRHLPPETRS